MANDREDTPERERKSTLMGVVPPSGQKPRSTPPPPPPKMRPGVERSATLPPQVTHLRPRPRDQMVAAILPPADGELTQELNDADLIAGTAGYRREGDDETTKLNAAVSNSQPSAPPSVGMLDERSREIGEGLDAVLRGADASAMLQNARDEESLAKVVLERAQIEHQEACKKLEDAAIAERQATHLQERAAHALQQAHVAQEGLRTLEEEARDKTAHANEVRENAQLALRDAEQYAADAASAREEALKRMIVRTTFCIVDKKGEQIGLPFQFDGAHKISIGPEGPRCISLPDVNACFATITQDELGNVIVRAEGNIAVRVNGRACTECVLEEGMTISRREDSKVVILLKNLTREDPVPKVSEADRSTEIVARPTSKPWFAITGWVLAVLAAVVVAGMWIHQDNHQQKEKKELAQQLHAVHAPKPVAVERTCVRSKDNLDIVIQVSGQQDPSRYLNVGTKESRAPILQNASRETLNTPRYAIKEDKFPIYDLTQKDIDFCYFPN